MKYRIITCLLAGICLTVVSGCGNAASVASSDTPSDLSQAEPEFIPVTTKEYTYDAAGRVLTETIRYHGEKDEIQETVYAYNPFSGLETLKDVTNMTKDGSPVYRFTTESEYDSNGRITKNTHTFSDSDDIVIAEHEYEELR